MKLPSLIAMAAWASIGAVEASPSAETQPVDAGADQALQEMSARLAESNALLATANAQREQANALQREEAARQAAEQAQLQTHFDGLAQVRDEVTATRAQLSYETSDASRQLDAIASRMESVPADPSVVGSSAAEAQARAAAWIDMARRAVESHNGMAAGQALDMAGWYLGQAQPTR